MSEEDELGERYRLDNNINLPILYHATFDDESVLFDDERVSFDGIYYRPEERDMPTRPVDPGTPQEVKARTGRRRPGPSPQSWSH